MPRLEGLTIRPCDHTATATIDGMIHEIELHRRSAGFEVVWPESRFSPSALKRIEKPIIRAAEQWFDLAGEWPALPCYGSARP